MKFWGKFFFSSTKELLRLGPESAHLIGDEIPLPKFRVDAILGLLNSVIEELSNTKSAIKRIDGHTLICGDLHGNVHDLFRILTKSRFEDAENYVFLGDYVDRGEYSLEVVLFLFTYYLCFPNRIILLRGDHEFRSLNTEYGFKSKLFELFGNNIVWEKINDAFDLLPLCAIVNGKFLCAHGGISPNIQKLEDLEKLELPIKSLKESSTVSDIVWSDPSDISLFNGAMTDRGVGKYYSKMKLQKFLHDNGLKALIRGHQKVDGVQQKWEGILFTVHSHSIPSSRFPLRPGYIKIRGLELSIGYFDVIVPPNRKDCYFYFASQLDDSERKMNWRPIIFRTNACNLKTTPKFLPQNGIRKSTSTFGRQLIRFPVQLAHPL